MSGVLWHMPHGNVIFIGNIIAALLCLFACRTVISDKAKRNVIRKVLSIIGLVYSGMELASIFVIGINDRISIIPVVAVVFWVYLMVLFLMIYILKDVRLCIKMCFVVPALFLIELAAIIINRGALNIYDIQFIAYALIIGLPFWGIFRKYAPENR
jgi:hypothetical protein